MMNDEPKFMFIPTSIRFPIKSYSDKRVQARFWMAGEKVLRDGEKIITEHLRAVERMYE